MRKLYYTFSKHESQLFLYSMLLRMLMWYTFSTKIMHMYFYLNCTCALLHIGSCTLATSRSLCAPALSGMADVTSKHCSKIGNECSFYRQIHWTYSYKTNARNALLTKTWKRVKSADGSYSILNVLKLFQIIGKLPEIWSISISNFHINIKTKIE